MTLTEMDMNGDGKVDRIILTLEDLPFATWISLTDTNYTGTFSLIEQVNRAISKETTRYRSNDLQRFIDENPIFKKIPDEEGGRK